MFKNICSDVYSLYRNTTSYIKSFLISFIILLFFSNCCFGVNSFLNASFETEYAHMDRNSAFFSTYREIDLESLESMYHVEASYLYFCETEVADSKESVMASFSTKEAFQRSHPGTYYNDRFDGVVLSVEAIQHFFPSVSVENIIGEKFVFSVVDLEMNSEYLYTYELEIVNYYTAQETMPSTDNSTPILPCFVPAEKEQVFASERYGEYRVYKDSPMNIEDYNRIASIVHSSDPDLSVEAFCSNVQIKRNLYTPYMNLIQGVGMSFMYLFGIVFVFYLWAGLKILKRELRLRKILGISRGQYYGTKAFYFLALELVAHFLLFIILLMTCLIGMIFFKVDFGIFFSKLIFHYLIIFGLSIVVTILLSAFSIPLRCTKNN